MNKLIYDAQISMRKRFCCRIITFHYTFFFSCQSLSQLRLSLILEKRWAELGMLECVHPRREERLFIIRRYFISFQSVTSILTSLSKIYNCKSGYHLSIIAYIFVLWLWRQLFVIVHNINNQVSLISGHRTSKMTKRPFLLPCVQHLIWPIYCFNRIKLNSSRREYPAFYSFSTEQIRIQVQRKVCNCLTVLCTDLTSRFLVTV